MGITKFTLVDRPEKMRNQGGYSIIFPQVKEKRTQSGHNQNVKKTKSKPKKKKQLSAKQFIKKFSDDMRDDISDFSYEGFQIDFDAESYDP